MSAEVSLEELMRIMATEPARAEEFWTRFLTSPVFVINGNKDAEIQGEHEMKEGDAFQILNLVTPDGTPFVPVFTSVMALQNAIREEVNYLAIPGYEVLMMTRGEHIGVNPGYEFGLLLTGEEIGRILDYFAANEIEPDENTQVLLGAPSEQPTAMKEAVAKVFKDDKRVQSAHFAMMTMPALNDAQSFIVGVVFKSGKEYTGVFDKAGAAAKEHIPSGYNLDFLVIDEKNPEGVADFLLKSGEQIFKA